jgi:uncharacterized protein (DUF433 family)
MVNVVKESFIPVNFVYLGPEGEEVPDKQFQARCSALPRVGEIVIPMAGSPRVVVTDVYHKLGQSAAFPGELILVPTVVLEEVKTALPLDADRPPLREDEGGVLRVGTSRISLDLVVEQYENGMTPEDMVRAYDTLGLADVHAAIAYYLRHRDEVLAYLKRRKEEAEALRAKIEAERPRVSREELLARRSAREKANAPTGQ